MAPCREFRGPPPIEALLMIDPPPEEPVIAGIWNLRQ